MSLFPKKVKCSFNCKLNNQGVSTIKRQRVNFCLQQKWKASGAGRGIRRNLFGHRAILNVLGQCGCNITMYAAITQNGVLHGGPNSSLQHRPHTHIFRQTKYLDRLGIRLKQPETGSIIPLSPTTLSFPFPFPFHMAVLYPSFKQWRRPVN